MIGQFSWPAKPTVVGVPVRRAPGRAVMAQAELGEAPGPSRTAIVQSDIGRSAPGSATIRKITEALSLGPTDVAHGV
jgi:hypothetical protein